MIYKYTIPLPPVTKKNSQRILVNQKTGIPFIAPSSAYKRYEAQAVYFSYPKAENPAGGALGACDARLWDGRSNARVQRE